MALSAFELNSLNLARVCSSQGPPAAREDRDALWLYCGLCRARVGVRRRMLSAVRSLGRTRAIERATCGLVCLWFALSEAPVALGGSGTAQAAMPGWPGGQRLVAGSQREEGARLSA